MDSLVDGQPQRGGLSGHRGDRGLMRYQMMQLIQLLLALSLIVGAFLGGLWAGWWRWGRPHTRRSDMQASHPLRPGTLFSPADRDDEIVLAEIDLSDAGGRRHAPRMVFGTHHHGPPLPPEENLLVAPPVFSGGPWSAAAIDPPPATFMSAEGPES